MDLSEFIHPPRVSDFHTHSNCSDGILSPADLARRAVQAGIDVLAITDHDDMRAVEPMQDLVRQERLPITIIPGVELSAMWSHGSLNARIHIVGLFCDPNHADLLSLIKSYRQRRIERIHRMRRLMILNIPGVDNLIVELDELLHNLKSRNVVVNRLHLAQFLVEHRICQNVEEAFTKYLYNGCPAGVGITYSNYRDVIATIKDSGGIPILAHPMRYREINQGDPAMALMRLEALIASFKAAGGEGIEFNTPNDSIAQYTQESAEILKELALKYNLQGSIGSDYHGDDTVSERKLGINQYIPLGVRPVWEDERFEGIYK